MMRAPPIELGKIMGGPKFAHREVLRQCHIRERPARTRPFSRLDPLPTEGQTDTQHQPVCCSFVYDIFLSYRRKDSQGHARHLDRELTRAFSPEQVFFDGRSIAVGADFREEIGSAIKEASVVVVLIGSDWLDAENLVRLQNPQDVVRREVAQALAQRQRREAPTTVIPVVIDQTPDPTAAALPEELHGLLTLNYARLRGSAVEFAAELERLIERIRQELGVPAPDEPTLDHVDKLPFLCNREKPEARLVDLVSAHYRSEAETRPMLLAVHGNAGEAHDEFVDRIAFRTLPRLILGGDANALRRAGTGGSPSVLALTIPSELRSATDLPGAFRTQLARALGVEGMTTLESLASRLEKRRYRVVVVRLSANTHELEDSENTPFEVQREFWGGFPAIPPGILLISFVNLVYSNAVVGSSGGLLGSLNPWSAARRRARVEDALRQRLAALEKPGPASPAVLAAVLPELTSPKISHVEEWARMEEVRRYIVKASRQRRSQLLFTVDDLRSIFHETETQPMANLGRQLQSFLEAYILQPASAP